VVFVTSALLIWVVLAIPASDAIKTTVVLGGLSISFVPWLMPRSSRLWKNLDRATSWLFDLTNPDLWPAETKIRCEDAMFIGRWVFGNKYVDGRLLLTERRLVHSKARLRLLPEPVCSRFRLREIQILLDRVEAVSLDGGPLGAGSWNGFSVRTRDSGTYRFDASEPPEWLNAINELLGSAGT
jgi:hypothetical protein